ncbi:sigma 54-interacting transcriptional regulator [Ekhidna sp.]|uniref:sigma 54-interacting transcriptional regulator n=1 Tax=Ekhidna sp. TaxID=2608089 RepID=UPI003B5AC198
MDHQLFIKDLKKPVVILDVDRGHFVDCNDLALDFFQLSKKEILKKKPYELSPSHVYGHEAEAYSRQVIQEALAGANPVFDWIHRDKDGNEIPCEVRLIRFPPYNRQLVRGTIIDKRLDNSAITRESEERLRLTLESASIGTYDWYPKEDKLSWDEGLFKIFELKPTDNIDLNAHFFSIIHPEDQERVGKEFEHSLTPEGPDGHQIEYRINVNGKVKHLLANSKMIRDKEGEVIRMLGTTQDITALRESEQKLKQSEVLFKSIVQDQEEMIVRWKKGGIRTFANRAYLEKFNLSEEEVIGSSFYDLIDKKDQKAVIAKLESLTPDNPTVKKSHRVYLPDGSTGWQEWTDRAIFDDSGSIVEFQSTGRDITEIVKAREALKVSEARYRNVFNQQFQFTALLDLDGKILHINNLALKTQGVLEDEFIGKYFWNSPGWEGNKEIQQKVKDQIEKLKKSKKPLLVEDRFKDPHGKTHYTKSHYSLIRNASGEFDNILVQAIDVTEEKESKKEIAEREKKLNNIFNVTSDILVLIRADKDYVIEEVNDSFLRLSTFFGKKVTREFAVGKSIEWLFRDLLNIGDEEIRKRYEKYEKVCETKERNTYTQRLDKEGRTLITEIVLSPLIQDGKVTHILIRLADITQQELAKIELEEAYDELSKLKAEIEQENIYLKEEIRQAHDFENMVFRSEAFRKILNSVEQVAKTDATVLITGETGTGKELIARAIHNVSKRSEKPMIKVNTAAIPRDLIESELFGHEKGAFTGAVGEKPGKFELADGGSIFLDEIGDMPLDLQVKILRVLQEGEVERLGSTSSKKINVRIITATNKNLEQAIKDGKFREDLYFRLNVFPIEIPPLRSRPDDIPILVEHFISKYNVKHSKEVKSIPKSVMDYLRNYTWPGNVRELENTMERAIILTEGEKLQLPEVEDDSSNGDQWTHDNSLEVVQENHIRKVLKECHWKIEGKNGAAHQLKIKPSTLRDKMRKFDIKRPD